MRRALRCSAVLSAALAVRGLPAAASEGEPEPRPTLIWIFTQLVPSPEVAVGGQQVHFGVRWQVTPVLYSFGINPRLSPWRVLVVEPIVRQSGSIEIFLTPELFVGGLDSPLLRGGIRSCFPVVAKGEELSVSLGTSYAYATGRSGVGYEVGAYVLYGTLGVQVTYDPMASPVQWITTLRFRYF
jgi:hypothetical protein